MQKHAMLVMAHSNYEFLELLLYELDHVANDVYLHIDRKTKWSQDKINALGKQLRYSKLFLVKRISVNWGGYSQVKCEINLLKTAVSNKYDYYHLISGADFPLKSQEEIHRVIEKKCGDFYLKYDICNDEKQEWENRLRWYYFFQEQKRTKLWSKNSLLKKFDYYYIRIQQKLGINRLERFTGIIEKGDNWFSASHEGAEFILDNVGKYKKYFRWSSCCDELFIHTILANEPNELNIVRDNFRKIDWERGRPYIWQAGDILELMDSECLFARKFNNESIDLCRKLIAVKL